MTTSLPCSRAIASWEDFLVASIYVMPVRPGRSDDFQAFVSELMGTRRVEWAQSQRRLAEWKRQVVFLGKDGSRNLAMVYSESNDPDGVFRAIAASEHPFDRWLAGKMSGIVRSTDRSRDPRDTAPKPGPLAGLEEMAMKRRDSPSWCWD